MWYEFDSDKKNIKIKHPKLIGTRWLREEEVPEFLLRRENYPEVVLSKIDKNGTHYYKTSICPNCGGDGVVYLGLSNDDYCCLKCKGNGHLAKEKTYKVYTEEYGRVLERQYIQKQCRLFLDKMELNEDGTTYVYLGNTYAIKDELKAKGAKWDGLLRVWKSKIPLEGYSVLKLTIPLKIHPDGSLLGYDYHSEEYRNVHLKIEEANMELKTSQTKCSCIKKDIN